MMTEGKLSLDFYKIWVYSGRRAIIGLYLRRTFSCETRFSAVSTSNAIYIITYILTLLFTPHLISSQDFESNELFDFFFHSDFAERFMEVFMVGRNDEHDAERCNLQKKNLVVGLETFAVSCLIWFCF